MTMYKKENSALRKYHSYEKNRFTLGEMPLGKCFKIGHTLEYENWSFFSLFSILIFQKNMPNLKTFC